MIFIIGGIFVLYFYHLIVTSLIFLAAGLYSFISLFQYIDRISRDLKRFMSSIKYSDFNQTNLFKNFGSMYTELYKSISDTYNELSSNRILVEENLHYLNTLIQQIPSGIISFKENGDVELINSAAKNILGVESLANINSIKENKDYFKSLFQYTLIGKEVIIKFQQGNKSKNISVFKSNFKLRNNLYTLITLKDMENELEKERLENELHIAQNVQTSLLPKAIPTYNNYDISVLFKPAKKVGGDFYDFFDLGKNKLGIIIGDVSGKGLGAAIYTTLLKGIFQTLAFECASTIELLTKANSLIYQMLDKKSFITAIYAILDTEANTLVFSRAGHEPLLVYENEKSAFCSYKQKGLGIGLEKGKVLKDNLEEKIVIINEKDIILFYTDGLTDLKNYSGIDNSLDKFKNIIAVNNANSLTDLTGKLENEINIYIEKFDQYDDVTTILIRRKF